MQAAAHKSTQAWQAKKRVLQRPTKRKQIFKAKINYYCIISNFDQFIYLWRRFPTLTCNFIYVCVSSIPWELFQGNRTSYKIQIAKFWIPIFDFGISGLVLSLNWALLNNYVCVCVGLKFLKQVE